MLSPVSPPLDPADPVLQTVYLQDGGEHLSHMGLDGEQAALSAGLKH